MSNLYASAEYKNKIINLLYQNPDFITLINPTPSECPQLDIIDVLNGGTWIFDGVQYEEQGYVFDYDFVDDTTDEEKTFCFVETDIRDIDSNIFTHFNLYISVFTKKNLVRLTTTTTPTAQEVKDMGYFATATHANRIDALCDCIDRTINGNRKIQGIGDVAPADYQFMTIYNPKYGYYGKILKYTIMNYNPGSDLCENR